MKKTKKLSPGMTLVEVMVAMTIFAIMAATIMNVIMRANKTANRSKMRDVELAQQTNIIGKKNKAGDQLSEVTLNSYTGEYTIDFNIPGKPVESVDGIRIYEAEEGKFSEDFGFQMKTMVKASSLGGLPISNLQENEYKFKFKNTLADAVTVKITVSNGYIFEGTAQEVVHTNSVYLKTIPAGQTAEIGYYNEGGFVSPTDVALVYSTEIGGAVSGAYINSNFTPANIDADKREVDVVFSQDGTNPQLKQTTTYPNV